MTADQAATIERLIGQARHVLRTLDPSGGKAFAEITEGEGRDNYRIMAARPELIEERGAALLRGRITEWYDDRRASQFVVERALAGDPIADQAIDQMRRDFRIQGDRAPALERYRDRKDARPPRFKRGPYNRNASRDLGISWAVAWLERCGVPPTRNPRLRNEAQRRSDDYEPFPPTSGCSLVVEALRLEFGIEISEAAAEGVWRNRDREQVNDLVSELGELPNDWTEETRRELRAIVRAIS